MIVASTARAAPTCPGRPVPALPVQGRPGHRDPGRLRRGRVREPLPVAGLRIPAGAGGRPFARRPGVGAARWSASRPTTAGPWPGCRCGIRSVVEVWADRTVELGALDGVEQVFPFENRGEEIGVTLHHPHGQIYAYPFVAPRTARQLDVARAHPRRHRRVPQLLDRGRRGGGERVVATAPGWLAFVHFAARWPFEIHCFPTRHLPDLPALDAASATARRAQGRAGPLRRAVRPAAALHAHLPPGAGAARPRPALPSGRSRCALGDQAQVPRLQRVGRRGVHQRHQPRAGGRAARAGPAGAPGERPGGAGGGRVRERRRATRTASGRPRGGST